MRKVRPVSCSACITDALVEQHEQAPPGARRRARTSAAMIGLALSMGASSLLLPQHGDSAKAAEPSSSEATGSSVQQIAALSTLMNSASVATPSTPAIAMVSYVVREGQTLWQVAQIYDVKVEALATANNLQPDAILRVGQTLKIPVSTSALSRSQFGYAKGASSEPALAASADAGQLIASLDLSQLPVSGNSTSSINDQQSRSDAALRSERDLALNRLRQERDRLRGSLAELKSGEPSETTIGQPGQVNSASSTVQAYQVRSGDTVGAIASTHHVSEQTLVATNSLPNPDWIRVNQSLNIPTNLSSGSATASAGHPTLLSQTLPNQTANSVLNPVSVARLSSDTASVDIRPQIQATAAKPEAVNPSTSLTYRVNLGDTIAEIARSHNVPLSALIGANHLSDPNTIFVGQTLSVPLAQPVSLSSSTTEVPVKVAVASTDPESSVLIPPEQLTSHPTNGAQVAATSPVLAPAPAIATRSTVPQVEPGTSALGSSSALDSNQYVESLLSEVRALREKYQHETVDATNTHQPATTAVTAASVASTRPANHVAVSPEFTRSHSFSPALPVGGALPNAPVSAARGQTVSRTAPAATPPQASLVAAAPLGSESYAPLMQPLTGRMVSPELPPLSNPDSYLPGQVFNGYIWPAKGILTSGFGWRWGRLHAGIDIAADVGTPVYAAAAGTVEFAGWNAGGYGNMIDIRHPDGSMTRYAHLNAIYVRKGQQLNQSVQIAAMGSTGYSTGPHLHFEVHPKGEGAVNPIAFLPRGH